MGRDPVLAFSTLGCQFTTATLKWQDSTSRSSYSTPGAASIAAWDATATPISLTKTTTGANIRVADGNFGNTNYDGITLDTSERDPTVYSCSGGTWDTTIVTWWNRYYADAYSAAKRQSVMVHELGHAFGLAHSSGSNCLSVPIMQPDTATRWDLCHWNTPQSDDVNGINFLY